MLLTVLWEGPRGRLGSLLGRETASSLSKPTLELIISLITGYAHLVCVWVFLMRWSGWWARIRDETGWRGNHRSYLHTMSFHGHFLLTISHFLTKLFSGYFQPFQMNLYFVSVTNHYLLYSPSSPVSIDILYWVMKEIII